MAKRTYCLIKLMFWIGIMCLSIVANCNNRPAIEIGEGFQVRLLNGEFGILATEEPLSISAVRALPDSVFITSESTNFLFSLTLKEHWLTYEIVNTGTEEKELLLEIVNPNLRKLVHYQFQNDELVRIDSAGTERPFHERLVAHQNFLLPIRISPGDTLHSYLMLAPLRQSLNFNLFCWERSARLGRQSNRETIWLVAFFQLNFIFFALILVAAFTFKAKSLWYYTAYVLLGSCLVFSDLGLGFRYLWPNSPYWQHSCSFLLVNLYLICGTQFIRHFFKTKRRHPLFDRIFLGAMAVSTVFMVMAFAMPYLPLGFAHMLIGIHYGLVLLCLVCFVIMFVEDLYKRKHYKTGWFLVAYALHGLGIIVTLLQYFGFVRSYSMAEWLQTVDLPITFYTKILLMIGMVLEIPIVIYIAYQDFGGLVRKNQRQARLLSELREQNMKELVIGVESERRRLAIDLHDGLSVNLAAIKMKANLMEIKAPASERPHWQEIMADVEGVYDELRHIVHNLPPRSLFRIGLCGALEEILQRTRNLQPKMTILYQYHLPRQRPKQEAEVHIFRMVLELLNNVLKHAGADEISIQLTAYEQQQVLLTVEDNGAGFLVESLKVMGSGLANIRQRANLLGGSLAIDSQPNQGTTMIVELAYDKVFD